MWDIVCTQAANLWIFRSFHQRYVRNSCSGLYPLFTFQKVHICMQHSQPIDYIVYSVREKTCTAPDPFVYFLDYYCIGQQGISSFILYANQTATKRFVQAIFCDFACF